MIHDVLAVIGGFSLLITAGMFFLARTFGRRGAQQNRAAIRREQADRARLPAEQVAADAALWSSFWTDHDLHKLDIPKEDKP
ncbi:hypothetical protein [Streptosporangium canum]|uniref:hypothetical protein n=1 Tax=Streptosporangium canum TaxID=324952 RepID=UPI0037AA9756